MHIIIYETHGHDVYHHGIVVAPAAQSLADALDLIDSAYETIREQLPNDWNYGDLFAALEALGFTFIEAEEWREPR